MRPGLALGLPLPWRVAILGLSGVAWVFLLASLGNARVPAVAAAIAAFRSCFVGMGVVRKHHCWLCGMTHAFNALHRGHVAEALKFNGNCLWPVSYTHLTLPTNREV